MVSQIALTIVGIVIIISFGMTLFLVANSVQSIYVGKLEQYNQWHADGITYTNYTVIFQNHSSEWIVFRCDYYHSGENITWNFDRAINPVSNIPEGC